MLKSSLFVVYVILNMLSCRKMMNRVSAQNARDRRKVYVEDLENKISLLEHKVQRNSAIWKRVFELLFSCRIRHWKKKMHC